MQTTLKTFICLALSAIAIPAFAAPRPDPTAVATISPAAVWEGDTVTLNATGSDTNPPGGTLKYQWQQQAPASPTITVSPDNSTLAKIATFIAPMVPLSGLTQAVTFKVKVTDTDTNANTMSPSITTTVYASPGANAGADAPAFENTVVMLSGSAIRVQPTGTIVGYTWTSPAGITFLDTGTSTSNLQNPMFTAPAVGPAGQALTFTLVVTEHVTGLAHDQSSAADSVTINVNNVNQPPTAIANTINDPYTIVPMATVPENTDPVTLYGFGTDPDNDLLTFSWTQVHDTSGLPLQPGDTVVSLFGGTSATPTFKAPNLTTQSSVDLVFQLITNDGHLGSGPSYVTIRVLNTNNPPTAVPTATPAAALEGDMVTLDGSGSTDPNPGDTLTYSWVQVGTPAITLAGANSQQASFVAPSVSGQITLTFNLTVDDGNGGTDTKPVSVTVSHRNQRPVAIATAPGMVPEGSNACLDASDSYDPEGDNVTFAWTQVDGPSVTLNDPTSSGPCFDTPNVGPGGADLHFQLIVADGHSAPSLPVTVPVHVNYVNHPPTANPGSGQTVKEGEPVHLSGLGTDPDSNPLTFSWSQFSGPTVTLSDATDKNATFTAPPVTCAETDVVMTLTVDDGYSTDSKNVTIHVENMNHEPIANGGGNQSNIHELDLVSLHGTGDDADSEEVQGLTFQWTQTSGPSATLNPSSGKDVSFTAPTIGGGNPNAFVELGFHLTVADGCGGTGTDDIIVHVANSPHSPVAVATAVANANEGGNTVMLDGSGSTDPDGDSLTYSWTQIDGPTVTLIDASSATASFSTPWVSQDSPVKFKLTVNDPYDGTSSKCVTVMINNSNQPPDISGAHADVGGLWPPDHRLVPIHILGVVDNQNNATITINSIKQDERTNGLGDGDTPVDAFINGDSMQLRAERSGTGDGRVYKITFTASDPETIALGNSPSETIRVVVPKSKKTDAAIDSGGNYDSTH